jgi:hypothetical protein
MRQITFSLAVFSCVCAAQTQPARLLIGGGLLGKLDGFCETTNLPDSAPANSCPAGRTALGGLYELGQELQKARHADSYVLLTGNNPPKDFNANEHANPRTFVAEFQSFRADMIALGQDDLLRAVFPAKQPKVNDVPSRFDTAVQKFIQKNEMHFLASNAAIRTNKAGLNKTWFQGYLLMISADQSIPWTTAKLNFAVPAIRPATVQATLTGGGQSIRIPCVDVSKGTGALSVTLTPNTHYSLEIEHGDPEKGGHKLKFEFQVDAALTPWDSNPGSLKGLPAAWIAHPPASPLLAVNLIDPAVLDILDPSRWTDKDGDGAHALVLYSPADAAKALLARADQAGFLPVLVTDLNDAHAAQVASSSSLWGVVSFSADSHMLGCDSALRPPSSQPSSCCPSTPDQ